MSVLDVEGDAVANHTYLIDTTGYEGGDGSLTTITMVNLPDGFRFGMMSAETPHASVELNNPWAVHVKIHGDMELDAFRRGLVQLVNELDVLLDGSIEERDAEHDSPLKIPPSPQLNFTRRRSK